MNSDCQSRALLIVIAGLLAVIALRPYVAPPMPVRGESNAGYPVFIEPGVTLLRAPDGSGQVLGKVVVDLRNGNVWGFPTTTRDPYPVAATSTKTPVSHPFLLGRYELADIDK